MASSGWPIRMMLSSLVKPTSSSRRRFSCFRVGIGRLWASSMITTWRKPEACDVLSTLCSWAKRASGLNFGFSRGATAVMMASAMCRAFKVLPLTSLSSIATT
ncbi:hypothetical protein D3C84_1065530 [compost metagenome]